MLSLLSPGDVETDTSALGQLQRGPPKALLVLRAESHQQEFETSGTERQQETEGDTGRKYECKYKLMVSWEFSAHCRLAKKEN